MDGRNLFLAVLISVQLCTSVWSAAVPPSTLPKSTHAKLLMDVVRLLSGSEPTTAPDGADKTGHLCPLKEASKCFNDALGKFYKSLLNDDLADTKRSICSLADDLDICNSALQRPECRLRETLTFDAINKGSRYFCTLQGYNNYLGLKPCLSHAHVVTDLKECKQKLVLSPTDTDECKLFDAYVNCAVESTKAFCAANIEDTLKESLTVLLQPYRQAICPMGQSEAGHAKGNPSMPITSAPSRTRREAEDFGSFFGGPAVDGFTGSFSPAELFGGQMPTFTDLAMPGSSSGEAGLTQETASPGFSWEQLLGQSSTLSNTGFLDLLKRLLSQTSGQGAGSSEEVSTMPTDVVTQEANSEEVTINPLQNTTPEISSEEVNTAAPGATTQPDSSEEVSTTSPDTTPQPDSSEEVSTTSPDTTTEPDSSEEESTSSPDTTPQPDSSEEVSTTSPDVTPQEPNSEEEPATTPASTPTAGTNSEEVTSSQPETTPPPTPAPEVATPTNPPQVPPTTQKSHHVAPFHCYECHSGTAGYWLNPMCPSNGKIHGWAALPVDCEGPCVSVITKYPKGEVYRACSSNYYFPFRVPHDGCLRHNQELYCFCSGDFCNNRDMVADQQAFILTGLITKY
ncbi:hypothetical protein BsWGS_23643 [Bradybaena similaris]